MLIVARVNPFDQVLLHPDRDSDEQALARIMTTLAKANDHDNLDACEPLVKIRYEHAAQCAWSLLDERRCKVAYRAALAQGLTVDEQVVIASALDAWQQVMLNLRPITAEEWAQADGRAS